jgi:formamidopyrimidine-DNA glycosylase
LQAFTKNLNKALAGKTLKKISVVNAKKLKVTEADLRKSLEKQSLTKVERVGKELHFKFSNDNILGLHLMLNGEFYFYEGTNNRKNTIIELLFDDDKGLALVDYQGLATPTLNPEPSDAPDALSDAIDVEFLKTKLNKKTAIKNVLLDQHVIRGIGNAYADEILWEAKIHPLSISNKVPEDKIKALVESIKSVLKDAEKQILKSNPAIISGEVRDFLKIHHAKKKESPTGALILNTMVNSRKTYYTDEQELFK